MSQAFTKAIARNIFYGGSVFFSCYFSGLRSTPIPSGRIVTTTKIPRPLLLKASVCERKITVSVVIPCLVKASISHRNWAMPSSALVAKKA